MISIYAIAMIMLSMGKSAKLRGGCGADGICHSNVTEPCCETCQPPLSKYISVDHGFGHPPFCGETCLEASKYHVYHLFEPNLTAAPNVSHPCAHEYSPNGKRYSHYNSTVTHGWKGVFSVTLDLYGPE